MTGCGVAVKVNAVSAASDWNDEGGGDACSDDAVSSSFDESMIVIPSPSTGSFDFLSDQSIVKAEMYVPSLRYVLPQH